MTLKNRIYKRQHYSPVVYLRQFRKPGSKNELWEYDLSQGVAKQSKPEECGCEGFYHSVALRSGKRDDITLEKAFHPLENSLPKLFEIIRHKKPMTIKSWSLLFAFAAIQEARCPSAVNSIKQFLGQIHQGSFELLCKGSSEFQKLLTALGLDPHEAPTQFEMEASQGSALLDSLQVVEDVERILSRMEWSLLCAPRGTFFLASDHPMCRWISPDKLNIYGGGLIDRDIEITVPLSRRICACGHWIASDQKTYKEISVQLVHEVNRRTVWNARNFVYGPANDTKIMEVIQRRKSLNAIRADDLEAK